jgi:esterase
MNLFYRQLGEGQPMLVFHGLIGSADNWLTQARLLSPHFSVYTIDQRNHGQSPHSDEFNYTVLAEDIKDFIVQHHINQPIIMGHSMGGKAAMNFAVKYPQMLDKLIVVDIAPKPYTVRHDQIVEGLKSIPIETLQSRTEADTILAEYVPEVDVRQFLLKNLTRKSEGGFEWKLNLPVIDENMSRIFEGMQYSGTFDKPTLFVRGKRSNYISDEDENAIRQLFPKSTIVTMDTGHWVQAEKPQEFVETVLAFLKSNS